MTISWKTQRSTIKLDLENEKLSVIAIRTYKNRSYNIRNLYARKKRKTGEGNILIEELCPVTCDAIVNHHDRLPECQCRIIREQHAQAEAQATSSCQKKEESTQSKKEHSSKSIKITYMPADQCMHHNWVIETFFMLLEHTISPKNHPKKEKQKKKIIFLKSFSLHYNHWQSTPLMKAQIEWTVATTNTGPKIATDMNFRWSSHNNQAHKIDYL